MSNKIDYEKYRFEALQNGTFWKSSSVNLRKKYGIPEQGFQGKTFLDEFYDFLSKVLKTPNIKKYSSVEKLTHLSISVGMLYFPELDHISEKFELNRQWLYDLLLFDHLGIYSNKNLNHIYYSTGTSPLVRGIYIKFESLMSTKEWEDTVKLAKNMHDTTYGKTLKSKTQGRIVNEERMKQYYQIEQRIGYLIRKGTPSEKVLSKINTETALTSEEDIDIRKFYDNYTNSLMIPPFNYAIPGFDTLKSRTKK